MLWSNSTWTHFSMVRDSEHTRPLKPRDDPPAKRFTIPRFPRQIYHQLEMLCRELEQARDQPADQPHGALQWTIATLSIQMWYEQHYQPAFVETPTGSVSPSPSGEDQPLCCDVPVTAEGFCTVGGGFPLSTVCPFGCPYCRTRLTWTGGCPHCQGCTTGRREDWTFPGDRYELHEKHWRKVADGPRPVTPVAEAKRYIAEIKEKLTQLGIERLPMLDEHDQGDDQGTMPH